MNIFFKISFKLYLLLTSLITYRYKIELNNVAVVFSSTLISYVYPPIIVTKTNHMWSITVLSND
jgi:hypothetical protein